MRYLDIDFWGSFIIEQAQKFWLQFHLPAELLTLLFGLVKAAAVLGLILVTVLFLVWLERKISAHVQLRLGPMRTGRWHGWAQTIADAIKLFLKEDIVPEAADRWIHFLAPVVTFVPALLCFAVIPFSRLMVAADLNVGLLYVFSLSSITVIGIIMAGWGSNNKYTLLGGIRSAAQMVSYEIPRALSILPVVMWAGSLKLSEIVLAQKGMWFIAYPVVGQLAFLLYLISSVAETNRIPFDLPEAEAELVAGFNTEYCGLKFAFFFLSEFAYVFLASVLAAALFFGGGAGPWLPSWIWFFVKTYAIIFLIMMFRWTYPRLRVDRLMDFSWKFLLPLAFINIVLAGILFLIF
ncbi:MAG: NADH-quinone oxidoreductase subunit NuoH [Elusimicrobiota bacterium]